MNGKMTICIFGKILIQKESGEIRNIYLKLLSHSE